MITNHQGRGAWFWNPRSFLISKMRIYFLYIPLSSSFSSFPLFSVFLILGLRRRRGRRRRDAPMAAEAKRDFKQNGGGGAQPPLRRSRFTFHFLYFPYFLYFLDILHSHYFLYFPYFGFAQNESEFPFIFYFGPPYWIPAPYWKLTRNHPISEYRRSDYLSPNWISPPTLLVAPAESPYF